MKKLQNLAIQEIKREIEHLRSINIFELENDILGSINNIYVNNPERLSSPPGLTIKEGLKDPLDSLHTEIYNSWRDIEKYILALEESINFEYHATTK